MLNTKLLVGIVAAISIAGSFGVFVSLMPPNPPPVPYTAPPQEFEEPELVTLSDSQNMKKFSSYDEIEEFVASAQSSNYAYPTHGGIREPFVRVDAQWTSGREVMEEDSAPAPAPPMEPSPAKDEEYSTTNVQVENVDEPDFLKNDDKYAYIVSGDKLTIIEAHPAESAKIILKIGLDIPQGQSLQNIFLNKDRLVIFYQDHSETDYIPEYGFAPSKAYSALSHAVILDVSDKENPRIVKDYSINGYYNGARMIGDNVYLVTVNEVNYPRPIIPLIREASDVIVRPDVFYFDNPEQYYNFNTVTAFGIFEDKISAETFLMSGSGTLYVSESNIYITYQKNLPYNYYQAQEKNRFFDAILPVLPSDVQQKITTITQDSTIPEQEKWNRVSDLLQDVYNRMSQSEKSALFEEIQDAISKYDDKVQQQTLKTVVHKIAMDGISLKYVAKAEVPGRLLNQFSMDESGDRFRIATTMEYYAYKPVLYNNVYVLDRGMNVVGSLEKIAPDESIYSTRFMGDRLYMVTFKRIDPFFVIDMSADTPKVLGALKIPGYSNYLHPYDENHVIGIGKETKENQYGGTEVLGVKIALFDVTNVANPVELDVETIGKQGTESDVLYDHKALLFDREKNIFSIPIWEHNQMVYDSNRPYVEPNVWRGFYVYGISTDSGFALKGKIVHSNSTGYDYSMASRSFYIGDVLYTVTSNLMKMNDISDLHEINQLKLRDETKIIRYID
ncbi:MAG: copper amine oxidase [Nitrososphaera sp.]|nr:copper amine oxidase [Nitrososphaera sp.]